MGSEMCIRDRLEWVVWHVCSVVLLAVVRPLRVRLFTLSLVVRDEFRRAVGAVYRGITHFDVGVSRPRLLPPRVAFSRRSGERPVSFMQLDHSRLRLCNELVQLSHKLFMRVFLIPMAGLAGAHMDPHTSSHRGQASSPAA